MKKTAIAMLASLALVLGTGALVSSATAAPYPSSVNTAASISSNPKVNSGGRITITVRVLAGNARVSGGTVRVRFNKRTYNPAVVNGVARVKVRAPKVKRSVKRNVTAQYRPTADSIYKASPRVSKSIIVKARR